MPRSKETILLCYGTMPAHQGQLTKFADSEMAMARRGGKAFSGGLRPGCGRRSYRLFYAKQALRVPAGGELLHKNYDPAGTARIRGSLCVCL
jgi:hypothetical protein